MKNEVQALHAAAEHEKNYPGPKISIFHFCKKIGGNNYRISPAGDFWGRNECEKHQLLVRNWYLATSKSQKFACASKILSKMIIITR